MNTHQFHKFQDSKDCDEYCLWEVETSPYPEQGDEDYSLWFAFLDNITVADVRLRATEIVQDRIVKSVKCHGYVSVHPDSETVEWDKDYEMTRFIELVSNRSGISLDELNIILGDVSKTIKKETQEA